MALTDLSDIQHALERASQRLRQHSNVYAGNETAVREQLVLPVLRALGWDTENPEEVHPEDRTASGSADYTLKVRDRPLVTIEVKKGETDIAEPGALEQAHRYASERGIRLCMATNGSVWVLARSFEEGRDLRGRILWQVLLSEESIEEVTQKLALIARANIESIDDLTAFQDRLGEQWEALLADPSDLVQALAQLLSARLGSEPYALPYPSFIDDYIDQRVREMLAPPQTVSIDDGGTEATQPRLQRYGSAASLLQEAAERAIQEGRLGAQARIETGHSRYLVSPDGIHKNGKRFFSPRRLSNGLFIETHCSISTANRHAEILKAWNPRYSGRGRAR